MHDYQRVMRRLDKIRRRGSQRKPFYEGIGDLKSVMARYFECGERDWNAQDVFVVMGYSADIRDARFRDILKTWESYGYIRIVDTPRCLFTVLKSFS